jgi:hypothetical protein
MGSQMPIAQYRDQVNKVEITKRFGAPKVASVQHWYKAARKVIPELPDIRKTDWYIFSEGISRQYIHFELRNAKDEKRHLVIDRQAPAIG